MLSFKKHSIFAMMFSVVIVVLYFFLYCNPALITIQQQQQAEKMLFDKSRSLLNHSKKMVTPVRKDDFLGSVMRAVVKNSLKQVEINQLSNELDGVDSVVVSATCDFYGWLGFVEYINQLSPVIFLNDVSLDATKENELIIHANLMRYAYVDKSFDLGEMYHFKINNFKNPFVDEKQAILILNDVAHVDEFLSVSVYQLQYVGCLVQDNKLQAILKSNAGAVKLVAVGSTVGLQNAKVIKIAEDNVMLRTQNQAVIVIPSRLLPIS